MLKEKVAVILSVYINDTFESVIESIKSILSQTYPYVFLYVAIDGPVNNKIKEFLFSKVNNGEISVLKVNRKNVGLASSLNKLIKIILDTDIEFIARMDADDISEPMRLERQVNFLRRNPEIDIVGGYIREFSCNGEQIITYPLKNSDIKVYFRKRNPIAHVSVMFRRSFFYKSGLYPTNTNKNEDTLLWVKGFQNKCKFANIPEVLVNVRSDLNYFKRRTNFSKILSDTADRIYVVRKLRLGWLGLFYSCCYFILFVFPIPFKKKIIQKIRTSNV